MLIGYARVSTHEQSMDLQIDDLTRHKCTELFTDVISGAKDTRPGLDSALDMLKTGDTLVVWRMDRLGRSLKHLVSVVDELQSRGIHFKSLQESIDTNSAAGKFVFHVFAALSEFERNLIRERTLAGLAAAKARGRKGGRRRVMSDAQILMAKELYNSNTITVVEICKQMGISKPTFYRYVKKDS